MMVSLKHRLVILAMPKCASTSLEAALRDQMDVIISRTPAAKHTPYRKFDRFLRRYLETYTDGPLEVMCLFREPLDWLGSWWRYRNRDGLSDPARSARNMSFDAFVTAYLDGTDGPASVGSQARFVTDKDGRIGPDRMFRHDHFLAACTYLQDRLKVQIDPGHLNQSPSHGDMELSDAVRARAQRKLKREFEIYAEIAN
ncbi:MAG: gamma-glutamyl kinase [Pseudomonadota bacterium]